MSHDIEHGDHHHMRIDAGPTNGAVEVDYFGGDGLTYLEVIDTSLVGGGSIKATVELTQDALRALASDLIAAADKMANREPE